jgi:predicted secreted protein
MAIESSRFLLVKIENGASPTPVFNDLGAQSDGRIGMNAQRIDTSNKTTGAWRSGLAGLREFVVDVSGFANWPDTNGLDRLLSEAIAGNDFLIRAVYNSLGDNFQATVQATNLELNGANNNATQYSATFELSQGVPLADVSP